MNGATNPLYVAYMALHLANKTLDEIPYSQMPEQVKEAYANNEDIKSSLWQSLNQHEKNAVRKYNKEHELQS